MSWGFGAAVRRVAAVQRSSRTLVALNKSSSVGMLRNGRPWWWHRGIPQALRRDVYVSAVILLFTE